MNAKAIATRVRPLVLAGIVLALFGAPAHAQLMVDLKLDKKNFIAHEPIMATVKVTNLAGHDLVLAGPNGNGWLNFDVRRGNNGVSQRPDAPNMKNFALRAGRSVTKTVNLGRYYPLGMPANYSVIASVYYPPMKKYFSARRQLVNVTKGKTLWNQTFGIPKGPNRPIEFRKYSLLSFRDHKASSLYARISSQDDSVVYSTQSLGRVLRSFDPSVDVDTANRLHILHLYGPQFYVHSILDTDGHIQRHFYKETPNSRPRLVNQTGSLSVRGGLKTDRHGLAQNPSSTTNPRRNSNQPRNASERPPGLPPG